MVEKKKTGKKNNTKLIVGTIILLVILVLVGIWVKYAYFNSTFMYGDYEVTKISPEGTESVFYSLRAPIRIYGSLDIYNINLYNDPRELQELEVENNTREVLLDPKPVQVYLTFDPNMHNQGYVALATTEIARVMGANGVFRLPVAGAVSSPTPGVVPEKVITCNDSRDDVLVVELFYGNKTSITIDKNYFRCIKIEAANEEELIKASDKIVLTLLGI